MNKNIYCDQKLQDSYIMDFEVILLVLRMISHKRVTSLPPGKPCSGLWDPGVINKNSHVESS